MDYKELIEKLRNKDGCRCECLEAATAIETLLSERDAAQKEAQDLQIQWDMYGGDEGITVAFQKAEERDAAVGCLSSRPHHSTCKHGEHCDYISAVTGFPDCCSCDEWEWRGPRKGEA